MPLDAQHEQRYAVLFHQMANWLPEEAHNRLRAEFANHLDRLRAAGGPAAESIGKRTLLVEDLTTDGQSKIRFAPALRDAGAIVNHTFVVFFYGMFPGTFETLARMDIQLHHLCTWWDVLEACSDRPYFPDGALTEVRKFLEDPVAWSAAHGGISSAEEAAARRAEKEA